MSKSKTRKQKYKLLSSGDHGTPAPYHCDGFYDEGVCHSRGSTDTADIRTSQNGYPFARRQICNSNGMIVPEGMLNQFEPHRCTHCPEHREWFKPCINELPQPHIKGEVTGTFGYHKYPKVGV